MTLILSGTDGLSDVDGSAATPAIRGTDANTGIFFGADIIGFAEGGAEVARFNADAQFVAAAGTASLPVITTTGDTNTGIFFPAADTIAFSEGGAEAMRIDSSGNVGIGTSSPTLGLSVQKDNGSGYVASFRKSASDPALTIQTTGGVTQIQGLNSAFTDVSNIAMQVSGGNVGIGTSSPSAQLHIDNNASNSYATIRLEGSNRSGIIDFYNSTYNAARISVDQSGNYEFSNSGFASSTLVSRMLIDSSGNLLVGTTNSSIAAGDGVKILVSGSGPSTVSSQSTNSNTALHMFSSGASAYRFYVGWGGTIYATSTTISAISDIRFKENVRDLDAGLAEIMALKPRLYDWKEGKGADIKNARGFIAQEFETVFPDLIDEWKDEAPEGEDPYKSVRQDLIPVLVKAIQELKALVDTQASTITQLQADVAALQAPQGTP